VDKNYKTGITCSLNISSPLSPYSQHSTILLCQCRFSQRNSHCSRLIANFFLFPPDEIRQAVLPLSATKLFTATWSSPGADFTGADASRLPATFRTLAGPLVGLFQNSQNASRPGISLESGDQGIPSAVRYVIIPVYATRTRVKIAALFRSRGTALHLPMAP